MKPKFVFTKNSNGNFVAEPASRPNGSMFGTLAFIKGEVTEEKLEKAKEIVVDDVCRYIREIAKQSEEFFIIKTLEGKTSVGHKFFLPTVDGPINLGDEEEIQVVE